MKRLLLVSILTLPGCQFGYIIKSGYEQARLLSLRTDNEKVLADDNTKEETKRKIRLAIEAKDFAENELGLKRTKNYTSFVQLDRPYVSYIISASQPFKMEQHLWNFPLIGKMPYKGYFSLQEAQAAEEDLKKQNLDTYLRGASAYSTLGYFKDPILSSMLHYEDHDLVNTIIHETVHATLFIKSSADFNERMAVFLGNIGTDMFYSKKEGPNSPTVQKIKSENADERLFSDFISQEIRELKSWYETVTPDNESKKQRLSEIQKRFKEQILPKLKIRNYSDFQKRELNNAYLLSMGNYITDLSDFERLYNALDRDFNKTLQKLMTLEKEKEPEIKLKSLIQ